MIRSSAVTLFLAMGIATSCAPHRPVVAESELIRMGEASRQANEETLLKQTRRAMMRVAREPAAERTLDLLVLSGGGDYGAFGAGFLRAWSAQTGAAAMPTFDIVSGVSTGALIAPFAFLGTEQDLIACENLYRNPKADWVRSRGILGLLPDNISLAEVPGLERELRAAIDMKTAQRVVDQGSEGRLLFVNTTDLDQGRSRPFELTDAARTAIESGNLDRLHNIMLASAGIPGVFPPREIDGTLYADGGVTANILYGAFSEYEKTLPVRYKRAFPDQPGLHIRAWVILNNQVQSPPHTVQRGWLEVLKRSVEVSIRASTVTALRHLCTLGEAVNQRGDGRFDVHWVAIPDDWRPPEPGIFNEHTMRDLADLGAKLASDPKSWHTQPPPY